MFRKPPSPLDTFLQIQIPVLEELAPNDPVLQLAAGYREQELMAKSEATSSTWLCHMAGLQRNRGRMFAALAYAGQALEVALRTGSDLEIANGYTIRSTIQIIQGNYISARQTLAEIPKLASGPSSREVMAVYEETMAKLLLRTVGSTAFEFDEAGERCQRAIELYEDLEDVQGQIRCLITLSSVTSGEGKYFRALEFVDAGLKLSAEINDWRYLNQLLGCAAFAFRDQGYRQHVDELFRLSIDWSTYIGDRPARIRCVGGLGEYFRMAYAPPKPFGFDKSLEYLRQAVAEAEECGLGPLMLENQMALANLFQKSGNEEAYLRCRELAEKLTKAEAFEGALRVLGWNDLIGNALEVSRERRMATRLGEAIEGSADPFFVFDMREGLENNHTDMINEFRNLAANALLGIEATEVRLLTDILDKPVFHGLRIPIENAVHGRAIFEDEIQISEQTFNAKWFMRRIAPAGQGAVVTFRDVTSNKQIEIALREAAEKAGEADRAKTEFLANMSHEIRTPINGVLGLAHLLRDTELQKTARKYVDGIISSGTILLKVIGDVLDLSKIEARKLQIHPGPTLLRPLANEVLALFEGRASRAEVQVDLEFDANIPDAVILDGPVLRQVLTNLVGNAIKFTRQGSVTLRVFRREQLLSFSVSDTGIGIPSHLLDSVFEPFQRAGSEADGIDGTGLGLTISRRLVDLMGGQLTVTSEHSIGSTFAFELPLVVGASSQDNETLQPIEVVFQFKGLKVLLVEDNSVNVLVSEGILDQLGCDVFHAENGKIAHEMFLASAYDLVLMDVRMPVMDGLEATRRIRESEAHVGTHVPIIALTAGALSQEREACFEAGMDDYLVKPFSKAMLRQAIANAFPKRT